jgi:hypothetical protein
MRTVILPGSDLFAAQLIADNPELEGALPRRRVRARLERNLRSWRRPWPRTADARENDHGAGAGVELGSAEPAHRRGARAGSFFGGFAYPLRTTLLPGCCGHDSGGTYGVASMTVVASGT